MEMIGEDDDGILEFLWDISLAMDEVRMSTNCLLLLYSRLGWGLLSPSTSTLTATSVTVSSPSITA